MYNKHYYEKYENDYITYTDNIYEGIALLPDGEIIYGEFDCGVRGLDHNAICDNEEWEEHHLIYGIVRLVPETMVALIDKEQVLTDKQREMLEGIYEIEEY